jgi:putative ABC transport system ATP-binding protein
VTTVTDGDPAGPRASLLTLTPEGASEETELGEVYTIGRARDNDLCLEEDIVSRHHARIEREADGYVLVDLGTSNGTLVNGERLTDARLLRANDRITVGSQEFEFRVAPAAPAAAVATGSTAAPAPETFASLVGSGGTSTPITLREFSIGRTPGNDLVIDDPSVSRQHATIHQDGDRFVLVDRDSTNGTLLNGQGLVAPQPLADGDVIRLGAVQLTFESPRPADGMMVIQAPRDPDMTVLDLDSAPQPSVAAAPRQEHERASPAETFIGAVSLPAAPLPLASSLIATQADPSHPMVRLNQVFKSYKQAGTETTILKGITLQVAKGDFVAVVGPSGCGKSTLLNMITGIDRPDKGEVIVDDQPVHALSDNKMARWRGRNVGIVFQFFQLLPTLTALENVMIPSYFCGTYKSGARRQRAMECLELVGMEKHADRLPSALSGGQQQRVAIARALVNDPPMLVGDEPTGNLDSAAAQQIFHLFGSLVKQGKTIVMVTHDPLLARNTPTRIEMLDGELVGRHE